MKRFLAFAFTAVLFVFALPGCGCNDVGNVGLVFVNDSDTTIAVVVANFENHSERMQHVDGSPLERGESFGLDSGEYPVTVVVYEDFGRKELARVTIRNAPPEGKRWYVTARGGTHGLKLAAETYWPMGVWLEDMTL